MCDWIDTELKYSRHNYIFLIKNLKNLKSWKAIFKWRTYSTLKIIYFFYFHIGQSSDRKIDFKKSNNIYKLPELLQLSHLLTSTQKG